MADKGALVLAKLKNKSKETCVNKCLRTVIDTITFLELAS